MKIVDIQKLIRSKDENGNWRRKWEISEILASQALENLEQRRLTNSIVLAQLSTTYAILSRQK